MAFRTGRSTRKENEYLTIVEIDCNSIKSYKATTPQNPFHQIHRSPKDFPMRRTAFSQIDLSESIVILSFEKHLKPCIVCSQREMHRDTLQK